VASESSFDVVSKVDRQEVDNALNQAAKEVAQRYDFKGTDAAIAWTGERIMMKANSEDRVKAVLDVFQTKLVKRGVSLKALDAGEPKPSGKEYRIDAGLKEGLSQENAKKITKLIRTRAQERQGPDHRRRAAGLRQEPGRPPGSDRPAQGHRPGRRAPVHQLPLTRPASSGGHLWHKPGPASS
jgi:uncharacterized protein YajQ (UPF0234 family)